MQPLGKVPTNKKEESESIFWAVAVFGFFLTGVLFVTIPAFQVGGNSCTQTSVIVVYEAVATRDKPLLLRLLCVQACSRPPMQNPVRHHQRKHMPLAALPLPWLL